MGWKENSLIWWSVDGEKWFQVTDHNRAELSITPERIETSNRMVDGTLRRYTVATKNTYEISWSSVPSQNIGNFSTADGAPAGRDIEDYCKKNEAFMMRLKKGTDLNTDINDGSIEQVTVVVTDFSKEIIKRGTSGDLWSMSVSLEEV